MLGMKETKIKNTTSSAARKRSTRVVHYGPGTSKLGRDYIKRLVMAAAKAG